MKISRVPFGCEFEHEIQGDGLEGWRKAVRTKVWAITGGGKRQYTSIYIHWQCHWHNAVMAERLGNNWDLDLQSWYWFEALVCSLFSSSHLLHFFFEVIGAVSNHGIAKREIPSKKRRCGSRRVKIDIRIIQTKVKNSKVKRWNCQGPNPHQQYDQNPTRI